MIAFEASGAGGGSPQAVREAQARCHDIAALHAVIASRNRRKVAFSHMP